jgi:hypothetical protein
MLIHILCSSLQQVRNPVSLLYLHRLSPGNGFESRSFLSFCVHVLTGRRLCHNSLNSITVLLITPQHGPHRKTSPRSSYIFASRSYRTDCVENIDYQLLHCCLRVCCGHYLATAVVYRAIALQRLRYSYLFRCRCLPTGLYATISFSAIMVS